MSLLQDLEGFQGCHGLFSSNIFSRDLSNLIFFFPVYIGSMTFLSIIYIL